jgi:cytochrome c oxidase subunit 3
VYLKRYSADFIAAGRELSLPFGVINTAVLLTSSLLAAMAVTAMERTRARLSMGLLGATLLCAGVFLVIKAVEWGAKFAHGISPDSAELALRPHGQVLFYGLYFTIAGLHALHVVVGACLLALSLWLAARGRIAAGRLVFLENSALYWHLVDMVWIFVFPLFYLIV